MTTIFYDLTHVLVPDTSTNMFEVLASAVAPTTGLYDAAVWNFNNTGSVWIAGDCAFVVPGDYVSNANFRFLWVPATLTSGAAVWQVSYSSVADSGDLDPSAHEEATQSTTTTTDAAQWDMNTTDVSVTDANLTALDLCQVIAGRDLSDAADTIGESLYLFKFGFLYDNA